MFTYIKNQYLWFKIKNTSILNADIDNQIFKSRLKKKYKWSDETCNDLILQYKQFLFVAATSDEKETPTKEVDDVWHEHILFTRDYFENWSKLLGKTIHHEPDREIDEAATKKVFAKTQSKLEELRSKVDNKKPHLKQATAKAKTSESNYSHSSDNDIADTLILSSLISSCSSHSSSPSEALPAEAPAAHCGSSSSHCSSSSGSSGSSCSSSSCSSSSCGSSCGSGD